MNQITKPIYTDLEVKENYILVKLRDGVYRKTNESSNQLIHRLRSLFNDVGANVDWLLNALLNPTSRGITGSLNNVIIDNNIVTLQPSDTMEDNPEDYAVEIDRSELIRLTREWQELRLKQTPLIYIYSQNNKCFVSETLPEGVE